MEEQITVPMLEQLLFILVKKKEMLKNLREDVPIIEDKIFDAMNKLGIRTHISKFDESNSLYAEISTTGKTKFDDEKFALDFGVAKAQAKDKETLIELAEIKKLSCEKFKEYFYSEEAEKVKVKKIASTDKTKEQVSICQ